MQAGGVCPSVALAALAESALANARVVVVGSALSPLPERLLERGARSVHVYDARPERVAEATRRRTSSDVSYAPFDALNGNARGGGFDVGLAENLASGPAAEAQVRGLARAVSRRGLVLLATPNPEAPSQLFSGALDSEVEPLAYYDFYDLVSEAFDDVSLLAQAPFAGYALATLGAAEDAELTIDTGFVQSGTEAPEWFVAACGTAAPPDGFAVVQLPRHGLAAGRPSQPAPARGQDERKLAALGAQLETLAAENADLQGQLERSRPAASSAGTGRDNELERLRRELAERDQWLRGLESRAATADERADEMQAKLEALAKQGDDGDVRLRAREQELASSRQREARLLERLREAEQGQAQQGQQAASELESRLEAAQEAHAAASKQTKEAERQLAPLRKRLEAAEAKLSAQGDQADELEAWKAEATQLEDALRGRAAEIRRLEDLLREAQRVGRELLDAKEAMRAEPESDRLDLMAGENAKLAADLEAARWTIATLERRGPAQTPATPPAGGEPPAPAAAAPAQD